MYAAVLALALALLAFGGEALACGHCVEDRVAAVYDHAVIVRALDRRHPVVFLAIEGPLAAAQGADKAIERALRGVPGVDAGSLRVSLAGAALSFAYDPGREGLGPILKRAERRLAPKGLGLSLLRVIDGDDGPR
ncbi:MAG TPA: hypothetical protein VFB01_16745 [Burkholderiales bacterium]|nr:hypothetical protein [Burkholderiales bacterium]